VKTVEMQFLSDVEVPCEACEGRRFNPETLAVRYRGHTIHEVLELTIAEAARFFSTHKRLRRILDTLVEVGLGYVSLGQTSTTLSGGEAQRIKLAAELARPTTGRTLYILDEPTTGLHMADVKRLLVALQRLVDAGNTVLVIEHNTDVIKVADWLIDMGPEGGAGGGRLVGAGTPEALASVDSPTGRALRAVLAAELHPQALAAEPAPIDYAARPPRTIRLTGVRTHNLQNLDLTLPQGQMTVITGPSGSGKTSLAFDTIFAEGQRRYVESLSTYARRFLGRQDSPPPSPSISTTAAPTRAAPWPPSPSSTTACACSTPASASPTAPPARSPWWPTLPAAPPATCARQTPAPAGCSAPSLPAPTPPICAVTASPASGSRASASSTPSSPPRARPWCSTATPWWSID